jgi:hypothetical protein
MGFWDKENVVRDVKKHSNGGSFYRINVVEKDGREGVDLRGFYEKKDGGVQHTKSGIMIAKEDLPEVIQWLQEAQVVLDSE